MVVNFVDDANGIETRKGAVLTRDDNSEVIDHSSDLEKESDQGMDKVSDSDAIRNLVTSLGDSAATEDAKVEDDSVTNKSLKKANEGFSRVKNQSVEVVLKPSSETSEDIEDEIFAQVKEHHVSDHSNGAHGMDGSDKTSDEEENSQQYGEQSIEEMEIRIDKLEEELREVAALEISLYSVVPEHGCSAHKVHTPARRLSRLYIHACKHWTQSRRATIAKNTVSGLVIIARSCGTDVPRLTFWLSNTVVLREIISQAFGNTRFSSPVGRSTELNGGSKKSEGKPSSLKLKGNFGSKQVNGNMKAIEDWKETGTFMSALVRVESWIFSRIVESVWWQALTPNMQPQGNNTTFDKNSGRLSGPLLGDQQHGNISIDLWTSAFQDAFRRLCPVRAAGHLCGCLPVLANLVMEYCVARLDVAMFNAILRESAHEIPTDPVSDPIVDPKVLPIPAGDLSFGSGAQLKNSIGNWCRWLAENLSMDTANSLEVKQHSEDDNIQCEGYGSKSFVLLNSLSDLLMLPKDMLMDHEIRKEVCPLISLSLIKRILCNFTPDEFCPDPVPGALLEALNAENAVKRRSSQDPSRNFPYTAAPVVYNPPSTSDVAEKVAEAGGKSALDRNVSQIQRKGYTSDEELEELNSPLPSIIDNLSLSSPSFKVISNGGFEEHSDFTSRTTRYELLRDVWSL